MNHVKTVDVICQTCGAAPGERCRRLRLRSIRRQTRAAHEARQRRANRKTAARST